MPLTDAEARELAALRMQRLGFERFEDFVKRVAPRYWPVPKHLRPLYDLIERSRWEAVRALVSIAPRHGKTITFMLALAWRCLLDPACQNFYTTFANTLSEYVGRRVRQLVTETLRIPLDRSSKANTEWSTVFGGGLKSTSLGGSIIGRGANGGLIIVDDIIKGMKASRSQQVRDDAHNYVTVDVMSRLEGGASLIVCGARWHEDDPLGRIAEDGMGEDWEIINVPAIGDELGMPIDERVYPDRSFPLWPSVDERYPNDPRRAMEHYRKVRRRNENLWWALYQGVPRAEDQKMFLEPGVYTIPLELQGKRRCNVLDPAATEKTTSDWSALGTFAMDGYGDDCRMFIGRIKKMHETQPQVVREAIAWQRGNRAVLAVEAIAGFAGIPAMIREMAPGVALHELRPGKRGWISGDKKTRAVPVSGAWNSGRVMVPIDQDENGRRILDKSGKPYELEWVEGYIKVVRSFTGEAGNEDDVVDITAHGWNLLYQHAPRTTHYEAPSF